MEGGVIVEMVHIFCQNEGCRMIVHLDDAHYWNYKGRIKCEKCGTEVEVEIKDGKVVYARRVK